MQPIPLPLVDGDTLLIDSSSTAEVMTCKRLAQYTFCNHLKSTKEKVALKAGQIMHKCLDVRYRSASASHAQTDDIQKVMIATAQEEYANWSPPEDDFRNYSTMVSLIQEYGIRYPFEAFEVMYLPNGGRFVEMPFMLPFAEIRVNSTFLVQNMKITKDGYVEDGAPYEKHLSTIKIVWVGKIDVGYRMANGPYIMDHKSSTMLTNAGEFTISHQMYGYVAAAEALLQEPVQGIVINRVIWRKPSRTGIPFTFERPLIPVSRTLLAEWKQDVLYIIADLLESIRRGYMQKETVWCYGKFGQCPFHQVCTLEGNDQRQIILNSGEYEKNTWSPLA